MMQWKISLGNLHCIFYLGKPEDMKSFHKRGEKRGWFFPTIQEECREGCSHEEIGEHVL